MVVRPAAARAPLRRASPGLSERGTAHGAIMRTAVAAAAAARLLVLGSPAADADLFVALEGLLLHEQQASCSTSSVAAWPA